MPGIEGLRLLVPPYWERAQDIMDSVEDAEQDNEKAILSTISWLVSILRNLENADSSPENVAWYALWTRLMGWASTLEAINESASEFTFKMLDRVSFETVMHLTLLSRGWLTGDLDVESKLAAFSVIQRLRVYTAWTLYNDLLKWKRMKDGALAEVWDPQLARDHVRDLGVDAEQWQRTFGEVEILSDYEAEESLGESMELARRKIQQIRQWLEDDRLADTYHRLEDLTDPIPPTLYQIIEETGRSVSKQLRQLGHGKMLYAQYSMSSAFLHGASLNDHFCLYGDGSLMPRISWDEDEKVADIQRQIGSLRHAILLLLTLEPKNLREKCGLTD